MVSVGEIPQISKLQLAAVLWIKVPQIEYDSNDKMCQEPREIYLVLSQYTNP